MDIQAIKARCEAVTTANPWNYSQTAVAGGANNFIHVEGSAVWVPSWQIAEFIAHARTDIPDLIAENERLLDYIDEIGKKAIDEHNKGNDRSGRLYGIADMCRPQNVNKKP